MYSTPKFSENHVVNPETGFIENPAFSYGFNSDKKKLFLETYRKNGLSIYGTCEQLHIKRETFNKHYHYDPEFRRQFNEVEKQYADELQSVSRQNALNPKSVIERIFQLKSLFPEKYGEQKNSGTVNVNINFDPNLLKNISQRDEVITLQALNDTDTKMIDNDSSMSANNESK